MNTEIASIIIGVIFAILTVIQTWRLHTITSESGMYDFIDSQINDLIKLQIEYPYFKSCILPADDKNAEIRYDAYATLVWNTLETIFEKYGRKKLRKSSFYPAMRSLATRHREWLMRPKHIGSYKVDMVSFLIEEKSI